MCGWQQDVPFSRHQRKKSVGEHTGHFRNGRPRVAISTCREPSRACGRRHFYGPLPFGSLPPAKSDRLLGTGFFLQSLTQRGQSGESARSSRRIRAYASSYLVHADVELRLSGVAQSWPVTGKTAAQRRKPEGDHVHLRWLEKEQASLVSGSSSPEGPELKNRQREGWA